MFNANWLKPCLIFVHALFSSFSEKLGEVKLSEVVFKTEIAAV
jgi:hypothetical protein